MGNSKQSAVSSEQLITAPNAKEYIIKNILPKFKDSTFKDYVKNTLAIDFAFEIANAWNELKKDKNRLDYLNECNRRMNEHYGNKYGWKLIQSHLVTRLMFKDLDNVSGGVDLNDANAFSYDDCRDAIDEAIKKRKAVLSKKYYLRNIQTGEVGNCVLWYGKNGRGYTCHLHKAEKFSKEEAEKIIKNTGEKYQMLKCCDVDKVATSQVDCQFLNKIKNLNA